MVSNLIQSILKFRLLIVILLHILFAAGSLWLSFILRFDYTLGPGNYPHLFYISLPLNVFIFVMFSGIFNLFQGIWRYVSVEDLKDILKTSAVSSLVFLFVTTFASGFHGYPRTVYLMNFALFVILNGGMRFTIRMFRESFAPISADAINVLIIGAGTAGNELVKSLKSTKNRKYVPVGFIDKNTDTHKKRIQGIKVLGDISTIKTYIKKFRVKEIFIAIPRATNKTVNKIIQASKVEDWEVHFKIVPSVLDIMSGKLKINQIRDVSISDLLSRPNITLDDTEIRKNIAGKTILITGAGGSIGSEICFQVATYKPAKMLLVDSAEEHAYTIDRDIKQKHKSIAVHTIVASVLDTAVLNMLMKEHKPDFIFHTAAYKHVHLMEWNPIACFKNNVLGTANLASIAEKYGVKQFVMISTDKAVNPKGIMGLSKRLAERVILERYPSNTLFNVVRFGNVLGSSGSVIPLFQKQIKEGGPVTVTSPDTERYFMSIPEAVQLVLQASTLSESKTIFLLEMGKPVKILDLAKNLIELSGLKVDEDIEIVFTGMRVGEKQTEELLTVDENIEKTRYDKLRIQRNEKFDPERINTFIHDLKSHVELGNIKGIYDDIKELIPEMTGPSFDEMVNNMFG